MCAINWPDGNLCANSDDLMRIELSRRFGAACGKRSFASAWQM